jgi:polysaccharide deacetylase 2 family uncharacterized protein YibQ
VAVSLPGARQLGDVLSGWRGLARFWGVLLLVLVIGGIVVQTLGPPAAPASAPPPGGQAAESPSQPILHADPLPSPRVVAAKPSEAPQPARHAPRPGRDTPGPVADPDPAMQEPLASNPTLMLPRISIDGRAPMSAYAAGYDTASLRPRVAILIAGIGMSEADSLTAIKTLPGGVTLAISPPTGDISRLLDAARSNEHEYLLSVPMEPQGYPENDPDDRSALMTSVSPSENMDRLYAILGRVTGYAGVTNMLGPIRGERLAGVRDLFDPVLKEVAARGLLFVDARTGQAALPYVWSRSADIVLDDDPLDAATLDQRLDLLTHLALDKRRALGIASAPRPVTVQRIAAWANTLESKGLALAPVSALMRPPAKQDQDK